MKTISPSHYSQLANLLRRSIGTSDWFNGSIELPIDSFTGRLTLSAIIYRRDESLPEGPRRPIADVVPVWWEFTTIAPPGPLVDTPSGRGCTAPPCDTNGVPLADYTPNDFSFATLRPYLIDDI